MKQTGIIKGNDLLADTNVIVSACPDGAFTVEGKYAQQLTMYVACLTNVLSYAEL